MAKNKKKDMPIWTRVYYEMERAEEKQLANFFKKPKDIHRNAKIKV